MCVIEIVLVFDYNNVCIFLGLAERQIKYKMV